VRHLVELHGGHVAAKSLGKGQGATFTVRLPFQIPKSTAKTKKSRQNGKASLRLKDLRLLIVDDDADIRELLAMVLQKDGAIVTTAASAQEALAQLETSSPDILISDIAMAGTNGYEMLTKLREMERSQGRPRVSSIALTAYAREEDRKLALEAGFDLHLSKPIDSEKLISSILTFAAKRLGKAS